MSLGMYLDKNVLSNTVFYSIITVKNVHYFRHTLSKAESYFFGKI